MQTDKKQFTGRMRITDKDGYFVGDIWLDGAEPWHAEFYKPEDGNVAFLASDRVHAVFPGYKITVSSDEELLQEQNKITAEFYSETDSPSSPLLQEGEVIEVIASEECSEEQFESRLIRAEDE